MVTVDTGTDVTVTLAPLTQSTCSGPYDALCLTPSLVVEHSHVLWPVSALTHSVTILHR